MDVDISITGTWGRKCPEGSAWPAVASDLLTLGRRLLRLRSSYSPGLKGFASAGLHTALEAAFLTPWALVSPGSKHTTLHLLIHFYVKQGTLR